MKVLITREIHSSAKELLEKAGHEVLVSDQILDKAQLIEKAKQVDALITMLSDKVDKELLDSCPNLKAISNYAVGYNNIDVNEATIRKIPVGNTPDVLTEATADTALTLMLCASRFVKKASQDVESGNWKGWEPLGYVGPSLRNKTLGIIGAGRIGQCLAMTAENAFNMDIIYTSRTPKDSFESSCNAKKVNIEELLKTSDIVSIHCDLNDSTRDLINKDSLDLMKQSAILINTSRGEVINQDDLIEALKSRNIFAAGLDVTTPEPLPTSSELIRLDNCIVLPHFGSATIESRRDMAKLAANNIISALSHKKMPANVNDIKFDNLE